MKTGIDEYIRQLMIEAHGKAYHAKLERRRKARLARQDRNKRRGLEAAIARMNGADRR